MNRLRVLLGVALLAAAAVAVAAPSSGRPLPGAAKCRIFPRDNAWNQRVDKLPAAAGSQAMVSAIGAGDNMHADFGSGRYEGAPIGIPYTTVSRRQRRVPVSFEYAGESDRGRYPIPPRAPVEGGLPGLARYDEMKRGRIDHALRFTVERTRRAYVYPARHYASSLTDPDLPAMGQRFRLRASFDTSRFAAQSRVVLAALKRYGMIVADNGSNWFVSGAPSRGWDNDDLHGLHGVKGSDFEVVDTSSLPRPR